MFLVKPDKLDIKRYIRGFYLSCIIRRFNGENAAKPALAEEEQELEALVESLDKTYTRYKMKISAEKTKLMTNSANGIQREIKVKGQTLGTVTSFKYLGAIVSDDGSNQRFSQGLHKPLQLLQS